MQPLSTVWGRVADPDISTRRGVVTLTEPSETQDSHGCGSSHNAMGVGASKRDPGKQTLLADMN